MKKSVAFSVAALGLSLASFLGCNQPANPPAEKAAPVPAAATSEAEHGHPHGGHGAGPHDGAVVDWGGGKYHVEFTVDHDKKEATVYILGSDEKTPAPVKADKLLLTIKEPSFQVELMPAPQEGETEGASRFVGTHENLGVVQEFAGTISGEVDGTPYAGDFEEEAHGDHTH
ncbi:MAG: hypothetical protein ACTHK7_11830 [Aureliella sp.]